MAKDTASKDTNSIFPEENRKFSRKKSDREKDVKLKKGADRKPAGEIAGKKTSSFVPKKVETGTEVKSRTNSARKPEKAESSKASAGKRKKAESRSEVKTGKKEKKQKKKFPPLSLCQNFSR